MLSGQVQRWASKAWARRSASCEDSGPGVQRCDVQFVFAPASNSRERLVFRGISVFLWNRINRAKRQHWSGRVGRLEDADCHAWPIALANLPPSRCRPGDHFVARGGRAAVM